MADPADLHNNLEAALGRAVACVRFGDPQDKKTWSVDLDPPATDIERAAIAAVITAFDTADKPPPPSLEQVVADLLRHFAENGTIDPKALPASCAAIVPDLVAVTPVLGTKV